MKRLLLLAVILVACVLLTPAAVRASDPWTVLDVSCGWTHWQVGSPIIPSCIAQFGFGAAPDDERDGPVIVYYVMDGAYDEYDFHDLILD